MESIPHEIVISKYSGSHFEIGKHLGQRAKEKYGPNYVDGSLATIKDASLYELLGMHFELTPEYIDKVFRVVEGIIGEVHPALLSEIRGFAEGVGEDYRRFLVFTSNFGNDTGCTQFYKDGHLARNYDDAPSSVENEFLLISPEGSFRSFGASAGYVERLDGINERGLAVSLTFGAGYPAKEFGIGAAMLQKIMLDKAENVNQALEIFTKAPYVTPNNIMLADASGRALIIESSAGKHRIRQADGLLVCANSYQDPEMKDQQKLKNPTTAWREKQVERSKNSLSNEEAMMDLLTSDFPNGLFEPYFTDGLGTLWSVIYTPSTRGIYLATGVKGAGRKEARYNLSDLSTFDNLPISLKTQLRDIKLKECMSQY